MIEAVNSTLSNAQLLRGAVEQSDAARSYAADPEKIQQVASIPQAPFVSPYISLDVNYNKAVLQIRDSETGDVVRQFPSEARLKAQRRSAAEVEAGGVFVAAQQSAQAQGKDSQETKITSDVAQAQIASQALAAGAKVGAPQNLSAGVSVLA